MEINNIFKDNFYEYAFHIVENRAIPDIRDGLKPVHRRIVYEMIRSKIYHNKPYVKVAKIVGQVMGLWHPHGDSSIASALVELNKPWKKTLPLIDIKGNNGSVYGDTHAAPRYIEARLTKVGESYGKDLSKDLIDYEDNYDNTSQMPTVLPAELPFLLINGTEGIAVGVSTLVPPHNPQNVIDTFTKYVQNPKISTEDLVKTLKGPDFPTAGSIVNQDDLLDIYKSGSGKLTVRGKIEYSEKDKKLHITQLPYTLSGTGNNLLDELIDASEEKTDKKGNKIPPKLPFIADVKDNCGRNGVDYTITLKRGTNIEFAINEIFRKTKLQSTLRFEFLGLNNKKIKKYSLKDYFEEFTEFRLEIIKRQHLIKFEKLKERQEILEGYIKLNSVVNEVIACAKVVNSKDELIDVLKTSKINHKLPNEILQVVKKFSFTEKQANIIANLPIYKINQIEFEKYKNELDELGSKLLYEYNHIIDEQLQRKELINNLPKFDTPRKTILTNSELKIVQKEAIPIYYNFENNILDIKLRKQDSYTQVMSDDRLFAMDKDGILWNIYLDKLTSGKYEINKLIEGKNIVNVCQNSGQILTIFTDGHMRLTDSEKYLTKARSKQKKCSNGLEISYFINVPENTQVVIDDKVIDNIPIQGVSGKGRKILKKQPNNISLQPIDSAEFPC